MREMCVLNNYLY